MRSLVAATAVCSLVSACVSAESSSTSLTAPTDAAGLEDGSAAGAAGSAGSGVDAAQGGESGAAADGGSEAQPVDADPEAPDAFEEPAPDVPNPCSAQQCFVGGMCVESGTPEPTNPCKACLPAQSPLGWTDDAANVTCDGQPYWHGVTRAIGKTPYGHATAISCHNCYAAGLAATLSKIHQAQADGADLIELDLKEQGGSVYVQHNDDGTTVGPKLPEVLADAQLKAGDQLLFLEFKETAPSDAFVTAVLDALAASGYGAAGRPVVLRAFDNVSESILIARRLLATGPYASLRPHVRLHVLFSQGDGTDIGALQSRIGQWRAKGVHGVEFEYQTPNLPGAIGQARLLDLGTNVWTVPVSMGEVFVSSLRDEADALTVDYPVAKARAVVTDKNGLVYFNVWDQDSTAASLAWRRSDTTVFSAPVGGAGQPSWVQGAAGADLVGTVLRFDASQQQAIALYDADSDATAGYFVSAAVHFDQAIPADGDTLVLIGKADSGAFSLEVFNPAGGGNADAELRFGVYVDGAYRYATWPASGLTTNQSYLITGAYDGDGSVWLWVNNSSGSTTSAGPYAGGVVPNDSAVMVGADPQAGAAPRFFFSGKLQMALVQKWANHP